ncbi:5-amino-6-(5-phosphoribosylamino)uracil reductase [Nocardioides gansuensis]|uniref:5-amino-6-(5-phosphoribosylamino)uracil reductase n=1 Tax=Nocardioides gansuensis TaxID=2138300 RepID=A0A2T8FEN0_9ACTN|nr:dihydrofolate reductase family protein [Nocardioides gansuensis]PVG84178.1 5-amino-6-(5-phosphoribosylamino)uracil reductase [Nocardioides gansuensis]
MAVTADLSVSLDLVAAGEDQSLEHPFGRRVGAGERLHTWMFDHRDENADEVSAITAAGAFIMGRHMFSPDRGEWDLEWRGWWGPEPPYHAPVFVLCSRPRDPLEMEGGTTFHFVTDGIEAALRRALDGAGDQDVAIAGGPTTINAYLRAGLLDELRLHIVPITFGEGLRIFDGTPDLELVPVSSRTTPHVTHVTWRR